jgi:small subunit ribosomal protein S13
MSLHFFTSICNKNDICNKNESSNRNRINKKIKERIYGLGARRTIDLSVYFTYFSTSLFFKDLTMSHQYLLADLLEENNFLLKHQLQLRKKLNIAHYKSINCYKGIRHTLYLPVRGQRTHSNAHVARYLGSGTFEYVPKVPSSKVKRLSKFSRRKDFILDASSARYRRLLNKNYVEFSKTNPLQFKYLLKKNKLGVFSKIYKDKQKVLKKANKGSKK